MFRFGFPLWVPKYNIHNIFIVINKIIPCKFISPISWELQDSQDQTGIVLEASVLNTVVATGVRTCSVTQSGLTLCDHMDCSPVGSSIHGIFQLKILEWVAISFSKRSCNSGIEPLSLTSSALAGGIYHCATQEAQLLHSRCKSLLMV